MDEEGLVGYVFVMMEENTGVIAHITAELEEEAITIVENLEHNSPFYFPEGSRWVVIETFSLVEMGVE